MVNVPFIHRAGRGSAKMSESQVETASGSFIFPRWGEAVIRRGVPTPIGALDR
jgi:hypothetical protein